MDWYKEERPKEFKDMLGETAKSLEKNYKKLPTCLLFTGPPGTGKTTSEKILRKKLNIMNMNLFTINCADKNGVDMAREIGKGGGYCKGKRLYIFDECHRITKEASQILLDTIEDSENYYIFITSEPQRLIPALKSRLYEVKFERVKLNELKPYLISLLDKKKIKYGKDVDKIIKRIYEKTNGGVRDSIKLLQGYYELGNKKMSKEEDETEEAFIARMIWKSEPRQSILNKISESGNIEGIRISILSYMSSIMKNSTDSEARKAFNISKYYLDPIYSVQEMIIRTFACCKGESLNAGE